MKLLPLLIPLDVRLIGTRPMQPGMAGQSLEMPRFIAISELMVEYSAKLGGALDMVVIWNLEADVPSIADPEIQVRINFFLWQMKSWS